MKYMKRWEAKLYRWIFTIMSILLFGSLFVVSNLITGLIGCLLTAIVSFIATLLWIGKHIGMEDNLK